MDEIQKKPPDEERLAALMGAFQPRPGARFHQKMAGAPWQRALRREARPVALIGRLRQGLRSRPLIAVAVILAATLVGLAASPAMRAAAQNLIKFFLPAASDQIAVTVTVPPPHEQRISGPWEAYTATLEEAQAALGFRPLQLGGAYQPWPYVDYDLQLGSITQVYRSGETYLLVTQRRLGQVAEYSSVGASAPVEAVTVRGHPGEFVRGGWRVEPSSGQTLATGAPGAPIQVEALWDPDLPQRLLRWQEDGYVFEILSTHGPALTQEELITIAAGLH